MDDFLRSFVTKVNVHSDTACDQDEARRVMEVLLPFVHERTPPDCLDKVLSSLSTLSCAMPDAFEACGGYERVVRAFGWMTSSVGHALDIVGSDPARCIDLLLSLETTDPFLELLTQVHFDTLKKMRTVLHVLQTLHKGGFRLGDWNPNRLLPRMLACGLTTDQDLSVGVFDLLGEVCLSSEALAEQFVANLSVYTGDACCLLTCATNVSLSGMSGRLTLVRFVGRLANKFPHVANRLIGIASPRFHAALVEEVREDAKMRYTLRMTNADVLWSHLAELASFREVFVWRAIHDVEDDATSSHLERAFDVLHGLHIDESMMVRLYETCKMMGGMRGRAACLLSSKLTVRSLLPHLPSMLDVLDRESCVELDERLAVLFHSLKDTPAPLLGEVQVKGPPPKGVLYHLLLDRVLRMPTPGKRFVDLMDGSFKSAVVKFVEEQLNDAPLLTVGGVRYARDLADACGLTEVFSSSISVPHPLPPTITCPITLESMHCPVVASDGQTYELSALVRTSEKKALQSPLTREYMLPYVYVNRAQIRLEEVLFSSLTVKPRRLRRKEDDIILS